MVASDITLMFRRASQEELVTLDEKCRLLQQRLVAQELLITSRMWSCAPAEGHGMGPCLVGAVERPRVDAVNGGLMQSECPMVRDGQGCGGVYRSKSECQHTDSWSSDCRCQSAMREKMAIRSAS